MDFRKVTPDTINYIIRNVIIESVIISSKNYIQ
jgi:hypothetical protein